MKRNDSFAENTVRTGCIASGVGAGCGLAFFATCASVGVAKSVREPMGVSSVIIGAFVALLIVVLVFLLVRQNVEMRQLRDEMARRDSSTAAEEGEGAQPLK